MKPRTLTALLLASVAGSLLASAALADPPARVGRIAYVEGDVSFQPPQEDDWTGAVVNFPVTGGEAFWTGDDGRAELQVGGIEARLDSETELDVATLRYGEMRLGLDQGSLSLRVLGSPVGGVTVSTPAGEVHIGGRGFYRIDVGAPRDDGGYPPVEVTVFQGRADAPGPSGYTPVTGGQAAVLYAGYDPQLQDAEDTAIDDWARDRIREEHPPGYGPAPEGMTGAEDLVRYGDFVPTPQYGTVWFPRDTTPDWAPYRDGRWAYVAPWGYTWIDNAPWGFAPFHYGRWARVEGRWGWIPGQATSEPVYAPALVAFIGGRGWGVEASVGGGALGWVPLAPDEVYRPPYQVSDDYYRRANVANVSATTYNTIVVNRTVTNVAVNNYRNTGAATVVRADAFRGGLDVRRSLAPVSADAIAHAPTVRPMDEIPPAPHPARNLAPMGGAGRPVAAPPARLRAIRAAVAAPTAGANHPPVIVGARLTPPTPPPAGQPASTLIAPAQARHPGAQHRQDASAPGAPAAGPPSAADTVDATARAEARRKARQDAAQKAGALTPTPTAPQTSQPPAPSVSPTPDAQARAAARRKAMEAGQPPAASPPAASMTTAPPPAAPPKRKTPPPAPSPATTAPAPGSAPEAAPATGGPPSDAQAQAQARRKARQEAAQKAAAAQASAPQPPPTPATPH